jgi:hypothetical protein
MIISHLIFLRMENFIETRRRKIKTQIFFNNFFSENRTFYEIIWKKLVEPERPQITTKFGACALRAG